MPPSGPGTKIEALINSFGNGVQGGSFSLQDLINLPEEDVSTLRAAHALYAEEITRIAPKLPYKKGSKGIVITASGRLFPQLIVSLRLLRLSGTDLPVEIFLECREVYEPAVCEEALPAINARCLVMSDILEKGKFVAKPEKYPLKSFAMLLSSFEDVVLMDTDNIALKDMRSLLVSEPFPLDWPSHVAQLRTYNF